MNRAIFGLALMVGWGDVLVVAAAAQSIVPGSETGTVVVPGGAGQSQIQGGTQAGGNLFHQFQQFGLSAGQRATFQVNPTVGNIFSRVTGGNASVINGLLQVTGGNANLFLINPAGVIFGKDARLDLPGSFTATTATALEFSGQKWLSGNGANQYGDLTGNVTGYAWLNSIPAGVVNAGELRVQPGQQVMLSGGTVINTGTIAAPGGKVTIAAVPGEKLVRVTQDNQVLSLDLPIATKTELATTVINPTQLPQLLAGRDVSEATGLTVVNGEVQLRSGQNPIPLQSNQAIVSGEITAPKIDVTGDRIDLQAANLNANQAQGGGLIRVGGDFQGQGDLSRARQVRVDGASQLQADRGKIVVWSDDRTQFAGSATAAGGLVETSGKQTLDVVGARVKARDWLLDPSDVTIGNAGTITPGTIEAALDGGTNVTITTAGGVGGNGDITLLDSINQTGGGAASLTLTGRRFDRDPAALINLTSTGNLTFNLNQVNPEAVATTDSIQKAIDAIGTVPGIRQINLAAGLYSATAPIVVNKPVQINGGDRNTTTITGNNATQVIRVLDLGADLVLENTTIRDGNSLDYGGAIHSSGKLTVRNSAFYNNQAVDDGGAIRADMAAQDTTIDNSIFENNSARFGGAIENSAGPGSLFTIQNGSTLANNSAVVIGGAILNDSAGRMQIINSTLERNTAELGGAIANADNADLTLTLSTVNDNIATGYGGGIATFTDSRLTIDQTSILRNQATGAGAGGAISADRATTVISRTGMAGNTALDVGGAIYQNYGVLSLNASSFSQNAARNGGAIALVGGQLNLVTTDFVDNQASDSGGAIRSQFGGVLDIVDSNFLRNQALNDAGGAISDNSGTTRITGGTIIDNAALIGGGIEATASRLTLDNVTVANNRSAESGGGIEVTSMLQTLIENSRILNNRTTVTGNGGGLGSYQSPVTIRDTTVSGNRSVNMGGGLEGYESDFLLERVTLTDNTALFGGGISNRSVTGVATTTITDSQILRNQVTQSGGGVFVLGDAVTQIQRTTIGQNTAGNNGGGIGLQVSLGEVATLNITNTTLSQNTTGVDGGGLSIGGLGDITANLTNATIANNTADPTGTTGGRGGGVFNQVARPMQLNNTIVANNRNAIAADVAGNFTDQGNNLIGISNGATGFTTSPLVGTSAAPIDPLLAPLANYGGLTQTIALLPGSPAINAGNSAIPTDQRGIARVGVADIGAFESRGFTLGGTGGGQTAEINAAFANPLQVTVASAFGEPVNGGQIQFAAPIVGAGVLLSSNPVPVTIAAGGAQLSLTANPIVGSYNIDASANGAAWIAFALTNELPPVPMPPAPPVPPTPPVPPVLPPPVLPPPVPMPEVPAPVPEVPAPVPEVPVPVPPAPAAPAPETPETPAPLMLPQLPVDSTTSRSVSAVTAVADAPLALATIDESFTQDYVQQFGGSVAAQKVTAPQVQRLLGDLDAKRGLRSAVIYAMFVPESFAPLPEADGDALRAGIPSLLRATERRDSDRLELIFITADGKLNRRSTNYRRSQVEEQMNYFWLTNNDVENPDTFQEFGQMMQQWLFAPIQADIAKAKINGLMYVLDQGLRSLPIAAMQTSQESLLQRYTISVVPSLGMLDRQQTMLKNQTTLAMGASTFKQLVPLPGVPSELVNIQQQGFPGQNLLNERFTLSNAIAQQKQARPGILHLATHADFNSGDPSNSFIQFWDQTLTLDNIDRLGLRDANLELLILSACNTATGDASAELGFTGMASLFGVRTAIGSLWSVSDLGTLAFMSEFYGQLRRTPSRADALRQTQLAMRSGQVRIEAGRLVVTGKVLDLPEALRSGVQDSGFTHPYYWSGFTMVGNPW
jgi:filamentous hemagglutinin family protein